MEALAGIATEVAQPSLEAERRATIDRHVDAWSTRDHARALLPIDHDIVEGTRAPRALIVERILAQAPDRDLFHASAMLGRLVAERGGSPSLMSSTIDGVQQSLGDVHAPWSDVRAALAEGYVAARNEIARRDACLAWEYPRCAVPIDIGVVAITAGYPDDDGEALTSWASRVANAASLANVRRAFLSGRDDARAALVDAFSVVGVEVVAPTWSPSTLLPLTGPTPAAVALRSTPARAARAAKAWRWLPWRRS